MCGVKGSRCVSFAQAKTFESLSATILLSIILSFETLPAYYFLCCSVHMWMSHLFCWSGLFFPPKKDIPRLQTE